MFGLVKVKSQFSCACTDYYKISQQFDLLGNRLNVFLTTILDKHIKHELCVVGVACWETTSILPLT